MGTSMITSWSVARASIACRLLNFVVNLRVHWQQLEHIKEKPSSGISKVLIAETLRVFWPFFKSPSCVLAMANNRWWWHAVEWPCQWRALQWIGWAYIKCTFNAVRKVNRCPWSRRVWGKSYDFICKVCELRSCRSRGGSLLFLGVNVAHGSISVTWDKVGGRESWSQF